MEGIRQPRVIRFVASIEKQAERNLEQLIIKAKASGAFGEIDWNQHCWDISLSQPKDRGHKQLTYRLWFTQHGTNNNVLGEPFYEPFASFAKALVRLRHEVRGQSCANHMTFIRALRYIYNEIQDIGLNPVMLNRDHFTRAEMAAKRREALSTAYRIGIHLTELARLLDENRLTKVRLDYKSSQKRPESYDRLSDTAKRRREKLMPKEEIFQALAAISTKLTNVPDKIRMNIIKILVFTGFRIGEVLTLPANTLVEEFVLNQFTAQPEIDSSGNKKSKIGLRYWPEKGAEPRIKWLPTEAGKLVKSVVMELIDLTKESREMASWLEENPDQIKLVGYQARDMLTVEDIKNLLGIKDANAFCRTRKIKMNKVKGDAKLYVAYGDLVKAISFERWDKPMLRLPNGKVQKLSESLCVVFFEQLSDARPFKLYLVRPISEQNISSFICGREGVKNVFERYGYLDHIGQPYKVRSHGFRHFLNTLANEGGLTDIELAWWFGRKNIGDNKAYDHRTATQMTEKARQMLLSGEVIGPIADAAKQMNPLDAKEFVAVQVNAVHHTPYGLCLHDFAQNPCDKHLNCLSGCKEFHRTKGNQEERKNLKLLKNQTTAALNQAKLEQSQESWGAENWINHNQNIIQNIEKALAIDDEETEGSKEHVSINPDGKSIGEPI
ncbi:MAG: uncharacterized protein K0S29_676 [Gammaproteobacteria bacterium]|jgi:hypothetical protein|nr:uncharacterized protein [Gammaproteobacteria bacterium]